MERQNFYTNTTEENANQNKNGIPKSNQDGSNTKNDQNDENSNEKNLVKISDKGYECGFCNFAVILTLTLHMTVCRIPTFQK